MVAKSHLIYLSPCQSVCLSTCVFVSLHVCSSVQCMFIGSCVSLLQSLPADTTIIFFCYSPGCSGYWIGWIDNKSTVSRR